MKYLFVESVNIIGKFQTGDTVTINIYDLSDNSLVVTDGVMSEIGTTGYFKYLFTPVSDSYKEYLYINTDGAGEEHGGKLVFVNAIYSPTVEEIRTEMDDNSIMLSDIKQAGIPLPGMIFGA